MLAAFLTTVCFSISYSCASRSAKLIGGSEANFWRLTCASLLLAVWACTYGEGLSGASLPVFLLSGVIGSGVGDVALFQTLPRLGPRLSLLIIQCLTAPCGAAIEWLWLGTHLTLRQMIFGAIVLVGIGISLSPGRHLNLQRDKILPGVIFGFFAAFGGAFGAVLSRKAYAVAEAHGESIDGATAAFQRILGGLLVAGIALLVVKWRSLKLHLTLSPEGETLPSKEKWQRVFPWVLANSVAGQTIGVSCFQWALRTTPAGKVLPIVATAPLVAIPIAMVAEKERPSLHSIIGAVIAVGGVIGLILAK